MNVTPLQSSLLDFVVSDVETQFEAEIIMKMTPIILESVKSNKFILVDKYIVE
jgi:hypothetical protein